MSDNTKDRSALEDIFAEYSILDEGNFDDLIEAIANPTDDGFERSVDGPARITAAGTGARQALALSQELANPSVAWVVELAPGATAGNSNPARAGLGISDPGGNSRLFIDEGTGHVGLGTLAPESRLTVNGGLSAQSLDINGAVSIDSTHGLHWQQGAPFRLQVVSGTGTHSTIPTSFAVADWIVWVGGFQTTASSPATAGGVKLWPYTSSDGNWYLGCELEGGPQISWQATLIAIRRQLVHAPASELPLSPPEAPSDVSAAPGNHQVTVSFTPPPTPPGVTLDGYTAISSNGQHQGHVDAHSHSITIDQLAKGTHYTFKVVALSSAGPSRPSATASATTFDVPGTPHIDTVTPGDGRATIHFDRPSDHGTPITGYLATVEPHAGHQLPWDSGSNQVVVDQLTNGTSYAFTLAAVNEVGTGGSSNSQSATPRPDATAPGKPTQVVAEALAIGQLRVRFHAPSSDGGSPITGYTVHNADSGDLCGHSRTVTPITVKNLTPGQDYRFTVTATNRIGSATSDRSHPVKAPEIEIIHITQNGQDVRAKQVNVTYQKIASIPHNALPALWYSHSRNGPFHLCQLWGDFQQPLLFMVPGNGHPWYFYLELAYVSNRPKSQIWGPFDFGYT